MNLADGETSLACYPAAAPKGRGVQATLTSHRLVWSDDAYEEHYPLGRISSVTYGFRRNTRNLGWAVVLLTLAALLGALLMWAQANLPALAETMVKTLADSENPERIAAARETYDRRLDLLMLLVLPLWGVVGIMVMHAAWLLYSGIRGVTCVRLSLPEAVRNLQQRGHDQQLLDFGESLARRVAGLDVAAAAGPGTGNDFVDWIPKRDTRW